MATQAQLYAALVAAGMPAGRARVGAAVGMAESGGNLRAHNGTPPDNSYGPWQINMIGALGPARRAAYGLHSNDDLFNLATSARVAKAISHNGANWGAWSTFKSGRYKTYLGATLPAGGAGGTGSTVDAGLHLPGLSDIPGVDTLTAPFRDFGKIIDAVQKTAAWVSDASNWVRVLYVLGGVVVTVVGLDMLVNSTGPGRAATKVVTNAAKRAPLLAAAA